MPDPIDHTLYTQRADTIINVAREIARLGWTPATSGNFSMRLDAEHAAITVSGRDKGKLSRNDIMLVNQHGEAVGSSLQPSAETLLHVQIYRTFPTAGVVLHTHSHTQSVMSRLFAKAGAVRLTGWELQKAIEGCSTHDSVLEIPVFPNTQHMPNLVNHIDAWLGTGKPLPAYLIDGHGLYTWGHDIPQAQRHLEALEFLLGLELDLARLST